MPKTKRTIIDFRGYNNTPSPDDGELVSMKNLSSDEFPCISPRGPRSLQTTLTNPYNLMEINNNLCFVDNELFWYSTSLSVGVSPGPKSVALINETICIFPDKKQLDIRTGIVKDLGYSYLAHSLSVDTNTLWAPATVTGFKAGDAVKISGMTLKPSNNKTAIIRSIASVDSGTEFTFNENTFAKVSVAYPDTESEITIAREVPDLDYVIEHENRVWGVKGNDVYASKLGDPTNWNVFDGLVSDSYATSVGTKGVITALTKHSGYLVLMKENYIHKLFGNKPANFQITETEAHGVQEGCYYSTVIINEVLYYKSRIGAMRYDGSMPVLISEKFGNRTFNNAVGGTDGKKYYLSMTDAETLESPLFVYDTYKGLWHIEDNFKAVGLASVKGVMWGIGTGIGGNSTQRTYEPDNLIFTHNSVTANAYSFFNVFGIGDTVTFAGATDPKYNVTAVVKEIDPIDFVQLFFPDGTFPDGMVTVAQGMTITKRLLTKTLYKFNATGANVDWEAETGDIDEMVNNKKIYSKLSIKAELSGTLQVFYSMDGGAYLKAGEITAAGKKVVNFSFKPRRCNFFRIKLVGTGKAKVYSIVREFNYGSDK